MDNIKKIIIILSIVIIILVIVILLIIMKDRSNGDDEGSDALKDLQSVLENPGLKPVASKNNFYAVKTIVNRYYSYLMEFNSPEDRVKIHNEEESGDLSEYLKKMKSESANIILSLLDEEYINNFNVTESNMSERLGEYKSVSVTISKMNVMQNTVSIATYLVHGMLTNKQSSEISEFTLMVTLDIDNYTYTIAPYEYIVAKKYDKLTIGDELKRDVETIDNREYNILNYEYIDDETVIKDYMDRYITTAKYNPKDAYNILDKDYREKRFGSLQEYEKYVKSNPQQFDNIVLLKYSKEKVGDNNRYICIDTNGNYYIIHGSDITQYTLILDKYTLDLPEFIETYDSTNDQGKVALNIDKFIQAINSQDYRYAYSCLAEGFKKNSFKDEKSFKEYVTKNFYSSNEIKYTQFRNEGTIFIYDVEITDKTGKNTKPIEKSIIMQLEEGTGFVMSFDV